jgi:hypothetical protein
MKTFTSFRSIKIKNTMNVLEGDITLYPPPIKKRIGRRFPL